MKKVFLGLVVAVVALSASAFTNVNSSAQGPSRHVFSYDSDNETYEYNSNQSPSCGGNPSPCLIQAVAPFTLPASGIISATDLNDPTKVQVISRQPQL